jgi:hypothetical protein
MMNAPITEYSTALGAWRRGSLVSSDSVEAVSKPYDREYEHAEDLEHHAGVVDDRDQPDPVDVQHGHHDQRDRREHQLGVQRGLAVARAQAVPAEPVQRRDQGQRQRGHHRGDGQDPGEQVDPPGHPGVAPVGQVFGPLEDRARHRVVAGHLGEVERHDELPERDDWPGPDEHPADRGQAQREQGEDPGRRRDVAERDRERAEQPERALEFLLIAEPGQVGGIPLLLAGKLGASAHRGDLPVATDGRSFER